MRKRLLPFLLLALIGFSKADAQNNKTPEQLAQAQLDAYNARNIEAFLEPYSDSVEIYAFPAKLLSKGKEAMRKEYGAMFQQVPNLHCTLVNRIIEGNTVIDHENVTGFGPQPLRAIAIYTISKGKISKVHFIQ